MHSPLRLVALLLAATSLLAQTPYSIDGTAGPPTDDETYYLELINRARANPAAEGERLQTTTDADVLAAVEFFNTNLSLMAGEMAALAATPPLAFNAQLLNAARGHSLDQFNNQFQGHVGSNGSSAGDRATAAGYSYSTLAENVFSTAESVFHGHAGFEIDWGNGFGGMQTGRGHRQAIHNATLREIGVGVVLGTNGTVGPQVVTQNFGTRQNAAPLLTGVAYYDLSGDSFYSPGEGLGGVAVTVSNAAFSATTTPSGAFTIPLPGNGTYSVRFSGLGFDHADTVTVANAQNVKLDLARTFVPPMIAGPDAPAVSRVAHYTVAPLAGATRYEFNAYRRDTATPVEAADTTSQVTLDVSPGYNVLQTAVRAQGTAAFNLRTVSGGLRQQTITMNRVFFGRPGATLTFSSRLAAAFPNESAHVQVSTDAGVTWSDVFSQAGTGGGGEASFVSRTVSLAALNGQIFRVRLLYSFANGSFYTSGGAIGWYVDHLQLPNTEEIFLLDSADLGTSTAATFTPTTLTDLLLHFTAYNLDHRLGDSPFVLAKSFPDLPPVITAQPAPQSVALGAAVSFATQIQPTSTTTYTWQRNGTALADGASATFSLSSIQPADTGLYRAAIENLSGTARTTYAILGLTTDEKVVGAGSIVGSDIVHPNGKSFDQILLTGIAETITADPGQVTRTSFIDLNNDIVQVEFSGPGWLSLVLDGSSGPSAPTHYNQSEVAYMKGHAGIVITGATEETNVSVFTVGRATANDNTGRYNILLPPSETNNPADNGSPLFIGHDATQYDGIADIAFIAIHSANGQFGGIRTSNTNYFASKGLTGIYAPGVAFQGPIFIGDLSAYDAAEPAILVGSVADARITGGSLLQINGAAIQVSGLTQLAFTAGADSHGRPLPAQHNQAVLRDPAGADVTAQIVANP